MYSIVHILHHLIILSIYPGIMMAVLEECVSVTHEIISMTTELTNVGNVRRYNPILIHVIWAVCGKNGYQNLSNQFLSYYKYFLAVATFRASKPLFGIRTRARMIWDFFLQLIAHLLHISFPERITYVSSLRFLKLLPTMSVLMWKFDVYLHDNCYCQCKLRQIHKIN